MLRRVLVVVGGFAIAGALQAASWFAVYNWVGYRDSAASLLLRFVFFPAIAVIVGQFAGRLSRCASGANAAYSLTPWILWLVISADWIHASALHPIWTNFVPLFYIPLAMFIAVMVFRPPAATAGGAEAE